MIYACYNKNVNVRMNSSSGGVYYAVAENVINNGGIVYAAVYEGFDVMHKRFDSIQHLGNSCGSKYVQSKLSDCFCNIKKDLLEGREVLFVGTPCECFGLKTFLIDDYCNLLTIDFVCHGVPSKKVLNRYLVEQGYTQPVDIINMRDKSSGWSKYMYSWSLKNNEKEVVIPQSEIAFMKGFTSDLYLRPSCYECHFKGIQRKTDITLGDYWGVWDIQPDMDDNKGTTLVIIHSRKGKSVFDTVAYNFIYSEVVDFEKALSYNPSIVKCAAKNTNRDKFFERLNLGENEESIINGLLGERKQSLLMYKFKNCMKKLLTKHSD